METLINHKQISLTNLANFPSFIRFRDVTLIYNYYYYNSPQPIAEKCELITSYLQVLKPALYDTRILRFHGTIDHCVPYYFSDHSQLLCHLRDQLLPICGNVRRYKFKIMFNTDKDAGGSVISSILQMPQIIRCSDVFIQPTFYSDEFPIEDISNWLHQKNTDGVGVGVENVGQKETQRFLQLDSCIIPNAQEMYKHLKKVLKFCLYQHHRWAPYMGTGGVGIFRIRRRSGGGSGVKKYKGYGHFFCTNVIYGTRYFISAYKKMNMHKLKHKITKKYQYPQHYLIQHYST